MSDETSENRRGAVALSVITSAVASGIAQVDPASLPSVESHELSVFVDQATNELAAEYQRVRRRAREDPGTAGDEGEENWRQLLTNWMPGAFPIVTKGRILSHDGRLSPQVDVIVLRAGYPPALLNKKTYMAGGVLAAFECKLTLKPTHVSEAAEKARAIRSLMSRAAGTPYDEIHSSLIFGLLAHSCGLRQRPMERVDELMKRELASDDHPDEALDVVCIANLACWHSSRVILSRDDLRLDKRGWAITRKLHELDEVGSIRCSYLRPVSFSSSGSSRPAFPVYSLIEHLIHRIAWDHPEHRHLADYWVEARTPGQADEAVAGRSWPFSFLSLPVRQQVERGELSDEKWSRWSSSD